MSRPIKILAAVITAAMCCAGGLTVFATWSRGKEAAVWPSLDDEPPLDVTVQPADDGWAALLPLLDIAAEDAQQINDSVEVEGPLIDPGFWVLVVDEVEALDALLRTHPTITSPAVAINDPFPSISAMLTLSHALSLRGWTSYEGADYSVAVDDILAAEALGRRLSAGGQSVLAVMIGLAIQRDALVELDELLAVTDDAPAHRRAAAALAQQPDSPAQVRAAMRIECVGFEQMFRDFGDNPAMLTQQVGLDEAPSEPGVVDRIAALRYDADATIAQHRRNCRATDAWLAAPPVERAPEAPDVMPDISEVSSYNRIGHTLLTIATPSADNMIDEAHRVRLQRSGLRLLTAARLYAYDHDGQLPEAAEALAPAYLPGPLPDPFVVSPLTIDAGKITSGDPDLAWSVTMPEGR